MNDHRISIRLLSPTGTPWQADTILGHLCWHAARGRGGMSVDEFLTPFRAGRPPFVLSDGFPEDLLPRPLLPATVHSTASLQDYASTKAREKSRFVTHADFQSIRRGATTGWSAAPLPWESFEVPHAAIDRSTGTTGGGEDTEGGQFFMTELTALTQGDALALYLRADDNWATRVPEMLTDMAPLGFGRDRSVGAGAFEVVSVEPFDGFVDIPNANGFISLSSYCPARSDPTAGYWRVRLKYGKLGEEAGAQNPFKRPLIQLEPGAVFWTDGVQLPYYGRAVTDIAPGMPEAVQCCYALAVPCVLPEELRP